MLETIQQLPTGAAILASAIIGFAGLVWQRTAHLRQQRKGIANELLAQVKFEQRTFEETLGKWPEPVSTLIERHQRPFVVLNTVDFLPESTRRNLHVLPSDLLKAIYSYYGRSQHLDELLRRIGSEEFVALSSERQHGLVELSGFVINEYKEKLLELEEKLSKYCGITSEQNQVE